MSVKYEEDIIMRYSKCISGESDEYVENILDDLQIGYMEDKVSDETYAAMMEVLCALM